MTYDFSILHPTIRLSDGWRKAEQAWFDRCDHPEKVEYILIIDANDDELTPSMFTRHAISNRRNPAGNRWGSLHVVTNYLRHCYVDAQNVGARWSYGDLLITSADDWFPCDHWDTRLHEALPDFSREAVIDVDSQSFTGQIIIYPMMTRAYYERPGRGGCKGELFYPEYLSMGSDDDLTEYAKRDGVVVNATNLVFEHEHPWRGNAEHDTHGAYAHVQSMEAWEAKDRILSRRKENGFTS